MLSLWPTGCPICSILPDHLFTSIQRAAHRWLRCTSRFKQFKTVNARVLLLEGVKSMQSMALLAELKLKLTWSSLFHWDSYVESGVISPDNISRPFDAGANGFSKAEGAVVVVLKPLEEALADNDEIYSVVRLSLLIFYLSLIFKIDSWFFNQLERRGRTTSCSIRSSLAKMHSRRFCKSRSRPHRSWFCWTSCDRSVFGSEAVFAPILTLVLGTPVGDPVEANASGEVFSREEPVFIGSVKGNTGSVGFNSTFPDGNLICVS